MKQFCRYLVVEVETADFLACGQKWKDFDSGEIRYINAGVFRPIQNFFRKITTYFRTVEIMGRQCVIVYWVYNSARCTRKTLWHNVVSRRGFDFGLRGWNYCFDNDDTREIYRRLLDCLGVAYENI